MIEWFEVEYFQSWKERVRVELSSGVNVFVGESDAGKSALSAKALTWLIENEPQGAQYYRSWAAETKDETRVTVKLDDYDETIARVRRATVVNRYQIGSKNLDAPGAAVPDQISRILRIDPVNIHHQGDGAFLISMSDPDKARYINGLVNLDIIARTQSNINSTILSESSALTNAEETLKRKTEELKEYDWIDAADDRLTKLETLDDRIEKNQSAQRELRGAIADLEDIDREAEQHHKITGAKDELDRLSTLNDKVVRNCATFDRMDDLVKEVEQIDAGRLGLIKIITAKDRVNELLELVESYDRAVKKETALRSTIAEINGADEAVEKAQQTFADLSAEFAIAMPDTCPLCDTNLQEIHDD